MELELTDEQGWLADSVEQLLTKTSPELIWPALVDFGALSIASGADGLGAVELALVGRALGESLAVVPFIDSAAARYGARPARSEHPGFCELLGGEEAVALCLLESGGGWELARSATTVAQRGAAASVIEGHKVAVQHATNADVLLVLYTDGEDRRIAVIGADEEGVEITPAPGFCVDDALPVAAVTLAGVVVPDEHTLPAEATEVVLTRLLAIGRVLAAGEAVGAAAALMELARDYATQRRQFGRTMGAFRRSGTCSRTCTSSRRARGPRCCTRRRLWRMTSRTPCAPRRSPRRTPRA